MTKKVLLFCNDLQIFSPPFILPKLTLNKIRLIPFNLSFTTLAVYVAVFKGPTLSKVTKVFLLAAPVLSSKNTPIPTDESEHL